VVFLFFFFFFFFFVVVLGFKLRALYLLGKAHHSTSPFFVMGIFEVESCNLFVWAGLEL
jgi:hypothetical protein